MKRSIGWLVLLLSVGIVPQTTAAQKTASSPVLQALEEEMKRAMTVLGAQNPAPYFMDYEVNETATVDIRLLTEHCNPANETKFESWMSKSGLEITLSITPTRCAAGPEEAVVVRLVPHPFSCQSTTTSTR
jgi:hypothetical protein